MSAMVTTRSPVWIFEIAREARRNAIDADTARTLGFMLHEASRDPACGAAVLVGKGDYFCAGSDLKELAGRSAAEMAQIETAKAELARLIQLADIPIIAAVEGFALGGGVSLAAACDIVVSSAQARWHMPEVANGWLPPWGIEPVVRRCGAVASRRVLWGAEPMTADQAHAIGLVDQLCDSGQARDTACALAARLAARAPLAVRSVKRYLRERPADDLQQADRLASEQFILHCQAAQAQETLARFGSKT